jgi:hypothetical protein
MLKFNSVAAVLDMFIWYRLAIVSVKVLKQSKNFGGEL